MSEPTPAAEQARCPRDGQSVAWHLASDYPNGRTNGEFIKCAFGTTPEPSTRSGHGARPEDYCPVCQSLDVTFPIGTTWTKCRTCLASWDAAQRVLSLPPAKATGDADDHSAELVRALRALADQTESWEWHAPVGPGNASYANGYEKGRRAAGADLRAMLAAYPATRVFHPPTRRETPISEPTPAAEKAHPRCTGPDGHTCQKPSGRTCVERGCDQPAGTLWGPMWCPEHDADRLNHVSRQMASLLTTPPESRAT